MHFAVRVVQDYTKIKDTYNDTWTGNVGKNPNSNVPIALTRQRGKRHWSDTWRTKATYQFELYVLINDSHIVISSQNIRTIGWIRE